MAVWGLGRDRRSRREKINFSGLQMWTLTNTESHVRAITNSFENGFFSDAEFVLLYETFTSKNPDFPYDSYERFNLDSMIAAECKSEFRVEKQDLPRLVQALQLPPVFKCEQRSICDDMEGLCMLLKRVAYPYRLSDMIPRFGQPVSVLSLIINHVMDYIYDVHGHRITQWNQDILKTELQWA